MDFFLAFHLIINLIFPKYLSFRPQHTFFLYFFNYRNRTSARKLFRLFPQYTPLLKFRSNNTKSINKKNRIYFRIILVIFFYSINRLNLQSWGSERFFRGSEFSSLSITYIGFRIHCPKPKQIIFFRLNNKTHEPLYLQVFLKFP